MGCGSSFLCLVVRLAWISARHTEMRFPQEDDNHSYMATASLSNLTLMLHGNIGPQLSAIGMKSASFMPDE